MTSQTTPSAAAATNIRQALEAYDGACAEYSALPENEQDGRNYEVYEDAILDNADWLAEGARAFLATPGAVLTSDEADEHFDEDVLRIDKHKPFALTVVIDNQDRQDVPSHPFTLNAYIDGVEPLTVDAGGALTEGTPAQQLRALADALESGRITR